MPYQITDSCVGCGACAKKCPEDAISGKLKVKFHIDSLFCSECGTCYNTCRNGAILDPQGRPSPLKGKKVDLKASIDSQICAACKTCLINCPHEAIKVVKKGIFTGYYCQVDKSKCVGCGGCRKLCIMSAITLCETSAPEEP